MPDVTIPGVRKSRKGRIAVINACLNSAKCRGWVLFPGVKDSGGTPLSKNMECKWAKHKIGDARTEWSSAEGEALCIALEGLGSFRFFFDEDGIEWSVDLNPGEAVFYSCEIPHRWEVVGGPISTMTVRTLKD